MKALPTAKHEEYYYCTSCDKWTHSDEWSEYTYYAHSEDELADQQDGYYYFSYDCSHMTLYSCDNCSERQAEVDTNTNLWGCSECNDVFEDKGEADDCCT